MNCQRAGVVPECRLADGERPRARGWLGPFWAAASYQSYYTRTVSLVKGRKVDLWRRPGVPILERNAEDVDKPLEKVKTKNQVRRDRLEAGARKRGSRRAEAQPGQG